MSFLLLDGKPALRNGKLLVGDDYGCCCGPPQGPCCCQGDLPDCSVAASLETLAFCGFGDPVSLLIQYVWDPGNPQFGPAFGCNFKVDFLFEGALSFQSILMWVDFAGQPSCEGVEGDYFYAGNTAGAPIGLGNFVTRNQVCDLTNATITVARAGNGYSFTISGSQNGNCNNCADLDGTYLLEP